jgi:hypothetical protein
MYRITGQAQYCTHAVQVAEAQVAAAEAAMAAAQRPTIAGDSYLEVGPRLAEVALAYDWCASFTTPAQRTRWAAYAEQAVFNVWNPSRAQWGGRPFTWSGWSINDPGNNYHYSFIQATMYWALASNSTTWRDFLTNTKLPTLQSFYATLVGGGSREGTGYGTAHKNLFPLYRVWRDSTGTDLANANSHLTDTISYWIHATVPTFDRFAPIGDQSRNSVPELYDYHRQLMLEARRMSTNAAARDNASWWLGRISVPRMTQGGNFKHDLLPAGGAGVPATALVYHATGVGRLFARTSWNSNATWLAFGAGPYDQSHAHQDQGGFTLFEADWLAVSENIWSHSGIQGGTEVQNVLRFTQNGTVIRQREPTLSTMTITGTGPGGEVHAVANLTPAYGGQAAVQSWMRGIDFAAGKLTVHDTFSVAANTTATFEINVPVQPVISGRTASAGRLRVNVVSPADATLTAVNWTTVDSDFNKGWRIDVRGTGNEFVVEMVGNNGADGIFIHGFEG